MKKKPENGQFEAWAEKKWGDSASYFLLTGDERAAFDAGWEAGAAEEHKRILKVLDDHPGSWYFKL